MQQPTIRIRGYHTDIYGHVNNARYLEFLEEGRWTLLETHLDLADWMKSGLSFFVVNINISYKKSVELGNTIVVDSCLLKFGTKSATLRQKILLKGTDIVCAEADITFVIADALGKALPMEGDVRKRLDALPRCDA